MRSGNLQADLGIDASDYNKVEITLKNPTTTPANANARLFVYLLVPMQHFVILTS